MRNDSVLYRAFHVAHDAKCFPPCVYSNLHRQLFDNFIPSQKCQLKGRMSIKERGRAPDLIENKASLRLMRKVIINFDMFRSCPEFTSQNFGCFDFLYSYDESFRQNTVYYTCHQMPCIVHHT